MTPTVTPKMVITSDQNPHVIDSLIRSMVDWFAIRFIHDELKLTLSMILTPYFTISWHHCLHRSVHSQHLKFYRLTRTHSQQQVTSTSLMIFKSIVWVVVCWKHCLSPIMRCDDILSPCQSSIHCLEWVGMQSQWLGHSTHPWIIAVIIPIHPPITSIMAHSTVHWHSNVCNAIKVLMS